MLEMKTLLIGAFRISALGLPLALLSAVACAQKPSRVVKTETVDIVVDTVATDITIPFGMAFLPEGDMLVTDRNEGKIWRVDPRRRTKTALANVPVVFTQGQAGLLDIVLHPDYRRNGWIYLSYSAIRDSLNGTVVDRFKLKDNALTEVQRIFTCDPFFKNSLHFGDRLVLHDGYLFLTVGERSALRDSAQSLSNHFGKVIRVRDDGTIPSDNPFYNTSGAKKEIWSYGHRNPQGLYRDPISGTLYESEHGPKGGDELNVIQPGKNYGWPIITYGTEYSGKLINEGLYEKEGLEQPLKYYKPSIGPSGLVVYTGDRFQSWKGNFFTGAMALQHLNRLVIRDGKVEKEERIFEGNRWRVRNVVQGPDGYLYLGVDGGMVLRLRPAK
jgi:glucose/arabinose dehydrogenase